MAAVSGFLAMGALLATPPTHAQGTFEGAVTYQVDMGGMSLEMVQLVKGHKMRQEMNGGPMSMINIMDMDAGTATSLIPAQKVYMEIDLNAMQEQAAKMNPEAVKQAEAMAAADFEPTGEKETIAGRTCQHYVMEMGDAKLDICAAEGMGFGMSNGLRMRGSSRIGMQSEKLMKQFPKGFFPLKTVTETQGQTITMVATKIEEKKVGDDMFAIPEGFTKMAIPGMGGN